MTETAHTDGTRVGQYKWDYLEIPEPRLPQVFLDLAEEARNVKVDSGRPGYTEEVQPQGTELTRPVFVTVMVDSPPVLNQPVAVGPVGQAFTPGPVGTHVRVTDCK